MDRQPLMDYGLSEDVLCNWLIMGSQVALIDFKIAAFRRSSISKSTFTEEEARYALLPLLTTA